MFKTAKFWILLFCIASTQATAAIRLLTFHVNRPDFIEIQHKTFNKFMQDEYELIVFNDAKTPELEAQIREVCEKCGILCIRYEQEWHQLDPLNDRIRQWLIDPKITSSLSFLGDPSIQPSVRHCHVIQYALDHFGYDHDDIVALVDGDLFPIRPIYLRELLSDCSMVGAQRVMGDIDYFWVIFTAFNPKLMPNKYDLKFNTSVIHNTLHDSGSETYHYLKNNPSVLAHKWTGHSSIAFEGLSTFELQLHGFNDSEIRLTRNLQVPVPVEFHLDHRFLHFCASSFHYEGYEEKLRWVQKFLDEILESNE